MRTVPGVSIVLMLACVVFCGAATSASAADQPAATTQPATHDYQLADDQEIDRLIAHGVDLDFYFKITSIGAGETLYFGEMTEAGRPEDAAVRPLIAMKSAGAKWKSLVLSEKFLTNYEWVYAGVGPAKNEVWSVLDATEDDPGKQIVLLHSTDGGRNWRSMTFDKPSPRAMYFDFAMSKDGVGRVTMSMEASPRDKGKGGNNSDRAGLYHFKTTDDGGSWTGPVFEPDAMRPADPVDLDDDGDLPIARPVIFQQASRSN